MLRPGAGSGVKPHRRPDQIRKPIKPYADLWAGVEVCAQCARTGFDELAPCRSQLHPGRSAIVVGRGDVHQTGTFERGTEPARPRLTESQSFTQLTHLHRGLRLSPQQYEDRLGKARQTVAAAGPQAQQRPQQSLQLIGGRGKPP